MTENTEKITGKHIDYLDEDPAIRGQEWICVSFLSPEGVKNCKIRGFKFRGAFATQAEAEAHAKEIQDKLDPDFHIYVGEGFKWLPWDQDPETVENQEYHEKELNDLMKSVKESILFKKQQENERKKKCLQEAMDQKSNTKESGKTKERLQKKLLKKHQNTGEQPKPEETPSKMDEKETDVPPDKEINECAKENKKIDDEKKEMQEVNNRIKKLESVYAKLCEKQNKKQCASLT